MFLLFKNNWLVATFPTKAAALHAWANAVAKSAKLGTGTKWAVLHNGTTLFSA